jgi:predicted SAM-dependent methyltransferase
MKLNLGSEMTRYEGWLNVDFNPICKPDYVADVRNLPFEDNSIDEIFASHVLEHTALKDNVLKEWERVLKPNRKIIIAVPDLLQSIALYRAGMFGLEYFLMTIYGGKEMGLDEKSHTHYQVFTSDMLLEQMRIYFKGVEINNESPRPGNYGEVMAKGYKK